MKPQFVLSIAVSSLLLLGFVTWRLQAPAPAALATAILVDRSDSVQTPCAGLEGTVQRILEQSASPNGSSLVLLTTGDARSANEPLLIASPPLPARQRLLKAKQRVLQEKQALVSNLKNRCAAQAGTLTSPVFFAMAAAVAHLRSLDFHSGDRQLFVVSDLRENVDTRIKKALAQPLGTKSSLPPPIDNTSIAVIICGYAQTRDQHHLPSERLIEVWSALFTHSQQVKFEPFCPGIR